MTLHNRSAAIRLILALAAAAALPGCAVYGPPYGAYDAGPVAAPYYAYPYGYGYGYGRPAYVGPPVSLNFGYYQHRYRGGYGGGWRGGPGGRTYGWGGHGGYRGGGRGHR